MKKVLAIIGSAGSHSANEKLVHALAALTGPDLQFQLFAGLKDLPHFDPDLSVTEPPEAVVAFRELIAQADGVLICTPEYVFSIPAGLKNALEWCVAATVFTGKPVGIITAAAMGEKAHAYLQLLLQTLMAEITAPASLLISGVKGKINAAGTIIDPATQEAMAGFAAAFTRLIQHRTSED